MTGQGQEPEQKNVPQEQNHFDIYPVGSGASGLLVLLRLGDSLGLGVSGVTLCTRTHGSDSTHTAGAFGPPVQNIDVMLSQKHL